MGGPDQDPPCRPLKVAENCFAERLRYSDDLRKHINCSIAFLEIPPGGIVVSWYVLARFLWRLPVMHPVAEETSDERPGQSSYLSSTPTISPARRRRAGSRISARQQGLGISYSFGR